MTYQPPDQLDMEMMLNDLGVLDYYNAYDKGLGAELGREGSEDGSKEHQVLPLFFQAQSTPQTDLNGFYSLLNQQLAMPIGEDDRIYVNCEVAENYNKRNCQSLDKTVPPMVLSTSDLKYNDKISMWYENLGIEENNGEPSPLACYTTAYDDDQKDPRLEYCTDYGDIIDYQAHMITKDVIERYNLEKEAVCYAEVGVLLPGANVSNPIGPIPNLRMAEK